MVTRREISLTSLPVSGGLALLPSVFFRCSTIKSPFSMYLYQTPCMASQQFRCPNQLCNQVFRNDDEVCSHLSLPNTDCSQWAMELFVNMMYRDPNTPVGNGSDDDDGRWLCNYLCCCEFNSCIVDPSLVPLYDVADAYADAPANHIPVSTPHASSVPEPPPFEPPAINEAPPNVSLAGLDKTFHPNLSKYKAGGANLLQQMDQDQYARFREANIHYPFASEMEWKLAKWLTSSGLPQSQINNFIKLDYVSHTSFYEHVTLLTSYRQRRFH